VIPLPKKVSEGLKEYYEQERLCIRAATERDGEAFILNNRGVRMRGKEYNSRIKRLVERSGIGKPEVSLHHLRHSIATHLLQGGMPMVQVRDFLGHNHLNTTQIYARAGKEQLNYL
jgi:integrase/recombinase XerD